jgi:hypothetical protein
MNTITRVLIAVLAGVALALPLAVTAGPDEAQRAIIQKAQEAKQKLAGAEAASGAERQKMMREHMRMMQDMMTQMQKAKPGAGMTTEQMREWIDEHLKLMNEMMGQMMSEHHMMMQGMGMPGTGKK